MADKVIFDGANRLIIVQPGITEIDVQADLYSDAKEDWKTDAVLNRLRMPFRTIGGDPLGGGITAGAYVFMQNQAAEGWRLRPYEGDHQLTLVGNLYPEDTALPIIVPTLGDYTVLVRLETSSLTQATDAATLWTLPYTAPAAGSYGEAIATILSNTQQLQQGGIRRGEAFGALPFTLVQSQDHLTPATGVMPVGQYYYEGMSDWGALAGTMVEFGFGVYAVASLEHHETDSDSVTYRFTATGCDPVVITVLPR